MPPTCTICANEKRAEIDRAIVTGIAIRALARKYHASEDALGRHREHIVENLEAYERRNARSVMGRVEKLVTQLETLANACAEEGRPGALLFLAAARELRPTLELMARVTGEMTAASVAGFLAAMGANSEADVRAWRDVAQAGDRMSLDDYAADLEAGLRLLDQQRPELAASIVAGYRQRSGAEVVEGGRNGHSRAVVQLDVDNGTGAE